MRTTYRYTTTTGEGTFAATREYLNREGTRIVSSIVELLHKNADWLIKPDIRDVPVEFYFTEEGKERFEASLKRVQELCVGQMSVRAVAYEELSGQIVYEDPFQIAIKRAGDREPVGSPYADPARYCF